MRTGDRALIIEANMFLPYSSGAPNGNRDEGNQNQDDLQGGFSLLRYRIRDENHCKRSESPKDQPAYSLQQPLHHRSLYLINPTGEWSASFASTSCFSPVKMGSMRKRVRKLFLKENEGNRTFLPPTLPCHDLSEDDTDYQDPVSVDGQTGGNGVLPKRRGVGGDMDSNGICVG